MDLKITRGRITTFEAEELKIEVIPCGLLGANCVILKDEGGKKAIIVDCGGNASQIAKQVKGYEVEYLIATHAHVDHVSGFADLQKEIGGVFCLHEEDIELLGQLKNQCMLFGLTYYPAPEIERSMKENDEFKLGSVSFKVIHTPGHSAGSVCLFSEEMGVLISGDTLFQMGIGRTDLLGGSFAKLKASITGKLFTLPGETVVITGHGGHTRIENEKRTNMFF